MEFKKFFILLIFIFIFTIYSCGVKGNPKPPPSSIPKTVENLNVKQYGDKFLIHFNYNPLYTDNMPMKEDFSYVLYKNTIEIQPKLYQDNNTYWFFDSIEGKEVCYQISVKTKRKESVLSKPVCIVSKTVNFSKPRKPSITITEDGLKLTITENGTFNIYKVKSENEFYPIPYKTLKEEEFVDTVVDLGKKYCYYLTFVDDGLESEKSETICEIFKDIFPPLPPNNGKILIDKNEATIIFQQSKSKDIIGYLFYKNSKLINNTPIKTYYFIDKDYKPGDVYFIEAVDKAGNKSLRLEITE